jgi:geranylgeranyl pyrophosphate synthase
MVLVGNFYWREQFLSIPFNRRILLLPHCLKHAEGCPAEYNEFGLDCERCGACAVGDYKVKAEKLGYKVLVAEGSPIVLKLIVSGYIDGILGVACLNVLEKAIDKVLLAGVPSYAVPLHSGDCKNTKLDYSWLWEIIDKYQPTNIKTISYVPLMRVANKMFETEFDELVPIAASDRPTRESANGKVPEPFGPLQETAQIAREFLAAGGKRSRPFLTLAAYSTLTMPEVMQVGDEQGFAQLPMHVKRVAMAMEAFHKASLVHDDIEDNDPYRYGSQTVHQLYDVNTAINVGDYLIGLGYRLISRDRRTMGGDVAADISDRLAQAHLRLTEGQGAELRWRVAEDKTLKPIDAVRIYSLKTSPAFEAALYAGVRLAGDAEPYDAMIIEFSKHLGVGFQILNDLKDWTGDNSNKLLAGADALAMRPTLLLALALESANETDRHELNAMLADSHQANLNDPDFSRQEFEAKAKQTMDRLAGIYARCKVFDKAQKLIDKSRQRVEALADEVKPDALRALLYFMIDTVLTPESGPAEPTPMPVLPIISAPGHHHHQAGDYGHHHHTAGHHHHHHGEGAHH